MADARLTVILPTRNRPRHCAAQLRFFRDCGLAHPILVADSSDPAEAAAIREACAGVADYRHFAPPTAVTQKFLTTLEAIDTPFVATAPDDDVTFPHAIDAALAHLEQNPDFVAAHGYVLYFGAHGDDIDIHKVWSFTPTIGQDEPLQRLYHLLRRYQPIIWAVFRTEVFAAAMKAASGADGFIFQELTFATTAALAGKIARLPAVFSMRGMEESMSRIDQINPLFWFVRDGEEFFAKYQTYRNNLVRRIRRDMLGARPSPVGSRLGAWRRVCWKAVAAVRAHGGKGIPLLPRFIRNRGPVFPEDADLQQVLDLIHGIWLGREVDAGILEHSVRRRLGDPILPIAVAPAWPGWREPAEGDAVRPSPHGNRRYIWRREVLAAEPKEEIAITAEEMARVEQELDAYRLDLPAPECSPQLASGSSSRRMRMRLRSAVLRFLESINYALVRADVLQKERETAAENLARLETLKVTMVPPDTAGRLPKLDVAPVDPPPDANNLQAFADIFDNIPPWSGTNPDGFEMDFLGTRISKEFLGLGDDDPSVVAVTRPRLDGGKNAKAWFEAVEWVQAAREARDRFVMIALGTLYGYPAVGSQRALQLLNPMPYTLVTVEPDPKNMARVRAHMRDNGIDPDKQWLVQAAIGGNNQPAFVPIGAPGAQAIDRISANEEIARKIYLEHYITQGRCEEALANILLHNSTGLQKDVAEGRNFFAEIKLVSTVTLQDVLGPFQRVDLLESDLKESEIVVFSAFRDLLKRKVHRIHIGTHSKDVHRHLLKMFRDDGWRLVFSYEPGNAVFGPMASDDGVLSVVNPSV